MVWLTCKALRELELLLAQNTLLLKPSAGFQNLLLVVTGLAWRTVDSSDFGLFGHSSQRLDLVEAAEHC